MTNLSTTARNKPFRYEGSVQVGTEIYFGDKMEQHKPVTSAQYVAMFREFKGKTVVKGTAHSNPPTGSLGAWLLENVSKTQLSSYVCAILSHEGYAKEVGADISFNS